MIKCYFNAYRQRSASTGCICSLQSTFSCSYFSVRFFQNSTGHPNVFVKLMIIYRYCWYLLGIIFFCLNVPELQEPLCLKQTHLSLFPENTFKLSVGVCVCVFVSSWFFRRNFGKNARFNSAWSWWMKNNNTYYCKIIIIISCPWKRSIRSFMEPQHDSNSIHLLSVRIINDERWYVDDRLYFHFEALAQRSPLSWFGNFYRRKCTEILWK